MNMNSLDVSRETFEKLNVFESLLRKWNPAINLVARSTLSDLKDRHIADSMQLLRFARSSEKHWVDLGSGGGLPGIVVGICLDELKPSTRVTLVESDRRKAAFLRQATIELALRNVYVIAERVETIDALEASTISARALASLDRLLEFSVPHLGAGAQCVFLKGKNYRQEMTESLDNWRYQSEVHQSNTSPDSVVLQIKEIERV